MSKLILEIDLGNDAMIYGCEIASALRDVSDSIVDSGNMLEYSLTGKNAIKDINGNTVGSWQVK